ncbi:conserved hypothetical protein ['Nostoc azollae' 0708]|jgi:hypothetical protein|uniref:Uncharacterized protein n=1 Tax=Nostoc azollae (strain 0708) TaxID=551115 RepID=D7E1D0_NOSA0|nr:conserved hypothetical protein ['Nostoc azollae' 0708]
MLICQEIYSLLYKLTKNVLVNYSNHLQVNFSSYSTLKERDWEALISLFERDDSDEIEAEIQSKLVWLVPEPCWEDNPFEFLREFL